MRINPDFRKVAILAANEAGKALKKNFRKKINISYKKDLTPLTSVDLMSDKIITGLIKKNFPFHGILSEESGENFGKEFTWIVDPLDGTTNYILGLPLFAVSLALIKGKEPILSAVFNPITEELYLAEKGRGAYLNGRKIRVNRMNNLSKVILHFDRGTDLEGGLKMINRIAPRIRTVRFHGSPDSDICPVASGKIEGFLNSKAHYHDVIAGAFIIKKEAGGRVTDFKGKDWRRGANNVLITNGKIHNRLLKLIKSK